MFDINQVAKMAGLTIPEPGPSLSTRPAGLHPTWKPVTERDPNPTDPDALPFDLSPEERAAAEAVRAHIDAWKANRAKGEV